MTGLNWWGFDLNAFLWVFIILNVVNVIIQTIKSIATVSWGKWGASIANAIAYSLYTVVVIFMNADGLGIMWKAIIIGLANLIGVYVVKVVEEKKRKIKLWKVEMTVSKADFLPLLMNAREQNLVLNYVDIEKYVLVNCYCATQQDSANIKDFMKNYDVKYFVSESKTL
jgi:hypothetical protein